MQLYEREPQSATSIWRGLALALALCMLIEPVLTVQDWIADKIKRGPLTRR